MSKALLFILCLGVPALGQEATRVTDAPAMKIEDRLKIRNLQFEQDKLLLEMQRIEARYKEIQETVRRQNTQIEAAVRLGAHHANIDLKKFIFDLDVLKFVPRAQPAATIKSLEVKPK